MFRMSQAAVCYGRARQRSRTGPCEDCRRVVGYRICGFSVRENFVLSTNLEYKTRGGRQVAKRNSDPRIAYPDAKVQLRDLVRVVGIVASFAPMGWIPGENSFYQAPGGNWHRRRVPGAPSSGKQRKRRAQFRHRTVWGL